VCQWRPKTVIEGVSGFLVSVHDSAALATKMQWQIEHRAQIEKMGQASLELCREKFYVNKVNREMLNYLQIDFDRSSL